MTDANRKNNKWIVAIHEQPPAADRTIGTIVRIQDPSTGELRDYAMMTSQNNPSENYVAEFQIMPADFSSFVVGRHVVKDGDLYLINRIDPLFFYLPTQVTGKDESRAANGNKQEPKKQSWQPYDQFLEQSKLPSEIIKSISEEQLQHICSTYDNEELYFKFNVDKALKWLQKKQERILKTLITQDERRKKAIEQKYSSIAAKDGDQLGGSVSSNFNFGKPAGVVTPPPSATKKSENVMQTDGKGLTIESLQIVCNYLNQSWSKKFIEHMGYNMDQVMNSTKPKPKDPIVIFSESKLVPSGALTEDDLNGTLEKKAVADKKAREASRTAGNKRLAKVNTKGMKSIASFFGAPKKVKR